MSVCVCVCAGARACVKGSRLKCERLNFVGLANTVSIDRLC